MARYLRFNGRLEQAKALLSGLKGLQPQTVQMHLELARIAVTEGRLEEAQDLYALEASLHPHNPQIYIERAQLSVRQDDTSGARSALASGRLHIPGFPHWGKVERDLFGPRAPAPDEPVKPSKRSAP